MRDMGRESASIQLVCTADISMSPQNTPCVTITVARAVGVGVGRDIKAFSYQADLTF